MYVIDGFLEDIYECASLMPRILEKEEVHETEVIAEIDHEETDPNEENEISPEAEQDLLRQKQLAVMENKTYLGELRKDKELQSLKTKILDRVKDVMEGCLNYRDTYDQYTYLWTVKKYICGLINCSLILGKSPRVYETILGRKRSRIR